jgi:hypothetical protein
LKLRLFQMKDKINKYKVKILKPKQHFMVKTLSARQIKKNTAKTKRFKQLWNNSKIMVSKFKHINKLIGHRLPRIQMSLRFKLILILNKNKAKSVQCKPMKKFVSRSIHWINLFKLNHWTLKQANKQYLKIFQINRLKLK